MDEASVRPLAAQPAPPLWRSPTAGALLTIALLVAATVALSIWLSILDHRRQTLDTLTREAHRAAVQIRGRLIETEQMLLLDGWAYPAVPKRFRADMEELLRANTALLRVELRHRDRTILDAVDAPPPRPIPPPLSRAVLPVESAEAFDEAARLNRVTYSRAHFVSQGETGMNLLELVVPTGDADGPLIVALYSPQRILEYFVQPTAASGHLYSLVEADGAMVARQAAPGQATGDLHATSPLGPAGIALQVRVDEVRGQPRVVPNVLTGLVVATSLGLGLAMYFLVRDVRRRARVEHALREQVGFRRSIEDAMLLALLVYDLQGRCIHVNAALCRRTGYRPDELIGRRPPMPFSTAESQREYWAYRDRIERARADGEDAEAVSARGFEGLYRARSGEIFPVLVVERPVRNGDGEIVGRMLLGADLTDQKRLEDLARRQHEALQSRSRLATLGEMASTLSHEINQPLAAITSYAAACENLMNAEPARPEPVRMALRGIKAQAERAGQVIHSVQSFLRRRAVERTEVDLAALVRGLEPLLRMQAVRTGARIRLDVPSDISVFADRTMLEQVLLNLTRNGFDAMVDVVPQQRVLELVARPVADDERGERIEISVTDRGRGVPADVLPQLFTPFFTTKHEGMGLGLSLCRSVIEQHGGSLNYRARDGDGGGSVFAFDLPRGASPRQADRTEADRTSPVGSSAEGHP